jgi:magnesium transporter
MPIVAAIGGDAGNQMVSMVVRAIALGQVTTGKGSSARSLDCFIGTSISASS